MLLSVNKLSAENLRGDLYGGATAAIVALPLALAFGVASGAGPVAGMYGAIFVGLFAALFGGTPSQISGPTGPMTIVSATIFTQFSAHPSQAFTVFMMAGAFQMLFGFLRIGRYINLLPYPVISGFMTGIGCILILMQIDPLLGYPAPDTIINAITVLPEYLTHPNLHAVSIGIVALMICFFTPARLTTRIPSPLIALAVCSIMALTLPEARTLGLIPTGLPSFYWPEFTLPTLRDMLLGALVIGALGSIDSLLTSIVADNATTTFHDSDKELVGQGLGNLLAGMFGGIPGAGATIRTLTNINAGGRTPLSGVIHAALLLTVVLGMGSVVAYIPHAALAGVLIKVGVDVIDWRFLRRLHRAPVLDQVLLLIVLLLTVFDNVITAVGVGVVLASLVFVKQVADVQVQSIRAIVDPEHLGPDKDAVLDPREMALLKQCNNEVLVLHLSGLMSFGAANRIARNVVTSETIKIVIIDLSDVLQVDTSACLALEGLIERSLAADHEVMVVGLDFHTARLLIEIGSVNLVKETDRHSTLEGALQDAVARVTAVG